MIYFYSERHPALVTLDARFGKLIYHQRNIEDLYFTKPSERFDVGEPDILFPHLTVLLLLEESEKQLREVVRCVGNEERDRGFAKDQWLRPF